MTDDLRAAASAARYFASTVAAIRALPAAGAGNDTVMRLARELSRRYDDLRAAIGAVSAELRQTRSCVFRAGDFVAPSAHEAAVKMVHALNRELFGDQIGLEIVGRKRVEAWPDVEDVTAEIEWEFTRAAAYREGKPATTWTPYKGVGEWAREFHVGRNTMATRLRKQEPRNESLNRQSYRLAVEDLPPALRAKYATPA